MKVVFWICWTCDIIIIAAFSFCFFTAYISGVMANKNASDIVNFLLILSGAIALVISAMALYKKRQQKMAAFLVSIPVASLQFIFLIPIVANLSGAGMN